MKHHEDFKTCEEIALGICHLLKSNDCLNDRQIGIEKAVIRNKYAKDSADKICAELDRLYHEPSLF